MSWDLPLWKPYDQNRHVQSLLATWPGMHNYTANRVTKGSIRGSQEKKEPEANLHSDLPTLPVEKTGDLVQPVPY